MSRRILLHVGTPKTAPRTCRTCSSATASGCSSRACSTRRPLRRALPGRSRPHASALGRPGARGRGGLGPARAARSRARRHLDHQPRDPGHRHARPDRPRARQPRARGRRRGCGVAPGDLGGATSCADPGRVAGERQAPRRVRLREVPRHHPRPDRSHRSAVGSGRAGDPRHPRPLGAALPPERVHLVTVPAPGSPRDLLWQRFSATFGLDDLDLDLGTERANISLGVPESALVRRINKEAATDLPGRALPAAGARAARAPHPLAAHRLGPPEPAARRLPLVADLTERWIAELEKRAYDVVGRSRRPAR